MTASRRAMPEDWQEFKLGDLLRFSNGINADKSAYGSGMPFANVLEVITHESLGETEIPGRINVSLEVQARYEVRVGDVLFNRTSETQDEVGLSSVYMGERPILFGGFVFRGRPLTSSLDLDYSKYAFRAPLVRNQIESKGQGGIRANISQRDLKSVVLKLPSPAEQRAIAEVLDDVSGQIKVLERLIAKKQAIEHGMMQQLLTGKTRLPGFYGDWLEVELREVVSDFVVPMRDKPKRLDGEIPWCRIEDFDGRVLKGSKTGQGVSLATVAAMNLKIFPTGTLLVSCSADLGRCAIAARPLVSNQTFIGLILDTRVADIDFFYYLVGSNAQRLNDLASGTTISYLSREQFEAFRLAVPQSVEEQRAIATVLVDQDDEIRVLRERIAKAKAVKRGMIQELLTGRTRLPIVEAVA